jgi:sarcosine oxidase
MIGSAATRYLSAMGLRVAAVGPAEPTNWQEHSGVFASHYDQGRITRIIDPDGVWAVLGARSIAAYGEIEAAGGIAFHHPVGCLRVSPFYQQPDDTIAQAAAHGDAHGAQFQLLPAAELAARFPFLHFAPGSTALWEEGGAGYINPRSLVAAQLTAAERQGATVIRATVTRLAKQNGVVELATDQGESVRAAKVLVAAGAYTNQLLPRPLDLRARAVSILLAEVDEAEAARLAAMPSIIYRLDGDPTLFSIYALPPIRYPDGRTYVKIGGALFEPIHRSSHAEWVEWFHGPGNPVETGAVRQVLEAMLPGLRVRRYATKPCVVTYTAHDHPYVDVLDADSPADGQLFVAAGGCGAAAKSSNEIGRMAALLVANRAWTYDIPTETFRACPA